MTLRAAFSLFFNNGRRKFFYCAAQLGMADNEMNCRRFFLSNHCPMPQIHNYLQIAKSIFFGLKQGIIRMRRFKIKCLAQMLGIILIIIKHIFFIKRARKRQLTDFAFKFCFETSGTSSTSLFAASTASTACL